MEDWDENVISQQIHKYLKTIFPRENHHDDNRARTKQSVTLLTFDTLGVSQHINHIHTH